MAHNLLAGEGFYDYEGIAYTRWPPLYPALLAVASLGVLDPQDIAGPFNAAVFGLTIFVVGQYLRRRLASRFLAVWAGSAVALSVPVADLASWARAGPLFILLAALALIQADRFLAEGKTSSLIWMAVCCALACCCSSRGHRCGSGPGAAPSLR